MGLGDEEKEHANSHNSRKETIARAHEAAVLKYGREVRLSEAKNMQFALQRTNVWIPRVIDAWEVETRRFYSLNMQDLTHQVEGIWMNIPENLATTSWATGGEERWRQNGDRSEKAGINEGSDRKLDKQSEDMTGLEQGENEEGRKEGGREAISSHGESGHREEALFVSSIYQAINRRPAQICWSARCWRRKVGRERKVPRDRYRASKSNSKGSVRVVVDEVRRREMLEGNAGVWRSMRDGKNRSDSQHRKCTEQKWYMETYAHRTSCGTGSFTG